MYEERLKIFENTKEKKMYKGFTFKVFPDYKTVPERQIYCFEHFMPLLREVFSHHRNVSSFLQLIEYCLYIKSRNKNKTVLVEEEKLSYWKDGNKESYSLNYGYNYFGEYLILRESWDYANIYYHLKTDRIILCYEPSFLSSSHDWYDFDEFLEALLWWKSVIEEKLGERLEDIE